MNCIQEKEEKQLNVGLKYYEFALKKKSNFTNVLCFKEQQKFDNWMNPKNKIYFPKKQRNFLVF